jgi:hypothetical protein
MSELLEFLRPGGPHKAVLCMLAITVLALLFMLLVEKKLRNVRKTDYELLFEISRRKNKSEFDIFHSAACVWSIPGERVEEDFKRYLYSQDVPHYVRHYIRKEHPASKEKKKAKKDVGR